MSPSNIKDKPNVPSPKAIGTPKNNIKNKLKSIITTVIF